MHALKPMADMNMCAGLEEDGYDSELIGDDEDRARLNNMNELEREMILAERAEAREQARERRKQAQMVEQRTRDTRTSDKVRPFRLSCQSVCCSFAQAASKHNMK